MIRLFSILALAIMFIQCGSNKELSEEVITDAVDVESINVNIKMIKGACFGQCPIYSIMIDSTGMAMLEGKNFMDNIGNFSKQLDSASYHGLKEMMITADLFQYDDNYPSDVADFPSSTLTYAENGKVKKIEGKMNKPQSVMDIEQALHEIATNPEGWTNENKEQINYIYSEIIIEPRSGVNLSLWFKDMKKKYGIRLLKRLSETTNYWLITYNTKAHDAEEVLEAVRADERIIKAEFNKIVNMR